MNNRYRHTCLVKIALATLFAILFPAFASAKIVIATKPSPEEAQKTFVILIGIIPEPL